MDRNSYERLLKRIDILETCNRAKGGFDYPILCGFWAFDTNTLSTQGWLTTTGTSFSILARSHFPMQNPKMLFNFVYNNSGANTTNWRIRDITHGVTIGSGSAVGTGTTTVNQAYDTSSFFVYGQMTEFVLDLSVSAGTGAVQPRYAGGHPDPDSV